MKNLRSFTSLVGFFVRSMLHGYKENTDHCVLVDQVVQQDQNFFPVCCICSVELKP